MTGHKTKVMTVVGTRPEIIRLSRVIARLESTVDHVLVHTGQNWDRSLSEVFFDDLDLPSPDRHLGVDTSSLGRVYGGVLIGTEAAIAHERPDALLVLGDTNSALAAVMARRVKVPVYHMEAGNRCFDQNVPEETNRRLVDHVADFNLVYTEHARRNLLAEGIHPRRILLTGSPMREVLEHYREDIARSTVLARLGLRPDEFFLVSAHREENVDDPDRLARLLACLRAVRDRWRLPVLVSTHPRTRKRLEARAGGDADLDGIAFHEPFGFLDYVHLQTKARCTLSDSGTISEESAILGFAAVTLRDSIERPESLDAGSIIMTGLDPAGVVEAVEVAVEQAGAEGVPCAGDYRITDASRRVVNFILSTVRRHHEWAGVRAPGPQADQGTRPAPEIGGTCDVELAIHG
ncbi:MAG: non-hydrolyzing UDP-N-acetylglucosamine 2-epimerase [Streptomycetales bacterium]